MRTATWLCSNTEQATPVIDKTKGVIYFTTSDGNLRGLDLADGTERLTPEPMVAPFSRNWSLNLIDNFVYTSTSRGCGGNAAHPIEDGGIAAADVSDPAHVQVQHVYTGHGRPAGPWSRSGVVRGPQGVYVQTADGLVDPASGTFGSSIISVALGGRDVTDSFTPPDQEALDARDFDLGSSSPVVFPFGDRTLVATSAKEGVIYLLDAKNLGGRDHHKALYTSPRWSNDAMQFSMNGMWSVISTYLDAQGKRWLLAPFYGPAAKDTIGLFKKSHGPTVNGQLMAFVVEGTGAHPTLQPQWVSGDLDLPGVAVVANGVILILANGDRGSTLIPGGRGRRVGPGGRGGRGGPPGAPRTLPLGEVNPAEPGFERDAAWRASQLRPFEEGGQQFGQRYSGGRDTTHAVLYALDIATGDEIYSSGDAMDSWNHYGGIALSDGNIYVSTWDARVFAFGLKK